jgi:hypothetical protein
MALSPCLPASASLHCKWFMLYVLRVTMLGRYANGVGRVMSWKAIIYGYVAAVCLEMRMLT